MTVSRRTSRREHYDAYQRDYSPTACPALGARMFRESCHGGHKGTVIAIGGGNGTPEIYETWKKLGGGKNANVVLIPTANNPGDDIAPVVNGLKQVLGVQNVSFPSPILYSAELVASRAAFSPFASLTASSLPQKCVKNNRELSIRLLERSNKLG